MSRPTPQPVIITEEDSNVFSLLFMDNIMFTGTQTGMIKEWNIKTSRSESVLQYFGESPILCLKSLGKSVLSREKNGAVHLWEKCESSWTKSLLTDKCYGFSNIEVDEQKDIFLSPEEKAVVQIYSVKTHCKVAEFKHNNSLAQIMSLQIIYLSQEPFLLSTHENAEVCLWDFRTAKILSRLKFSSCVTALDFSSVTQNGICGTVTDEVHMFNITKSFKLSASKTFTITNEGVKCIHIRPDNKIVALGCWDGRVRIFSWKTSRPLAVLDEFDTSVNDLHFVNCEAISKDGNYLMAACGDNVVAFWDIYNSK